MRNKKNKMYICNDSFGSRINVGDSVELLMEMETKTSWVSTVYWNMVDGAFVDAHPAHRKMELSYHRNLREFLDREDIEIFDTDDNPVILKTYCKKIKR